MCVRLMLPGEIALVTCPPDYAYDKFARSIFRLNRLTALSEQSCQKLLLWFFRPPSVPEGAYVQWEIELLGFETPKVINDII